GCMQSDKTRMPPHYFYKEQTVVRICCVADLVYRLHGSVHRRIETDGEIRSVEVVINSAGQADDGDIGILCNELQGAGQSAVAADGDEGVNVVVHQIFVSLPAAFGRHKTLAARCFQYGATPVDDVAHIGGFQPFDVAVNHAFISPHDAVDVQVVVECVANNCADGGIHARRVTAGCKYCDSLDIFCHNFCQQWSEGCRDWGHWGHCRYRGH